jgi:hypothetical protein
VKPTFRTQYAPGAVTAQDALYLEASMREAIDANYAAGLAHAPLPTNTLVVGPSLDASLVPGIQRQMQYGALVAYLAGLQDRADG